MQEDRQICLGHKILVLTATAKSEINDSEDSKLRENKTKPERQGWPNKQFTEQALAQAGRVWTLTTEDKLCKRFLFFSVEMTFNKGTKLAVTGKHQK